MAGIYIHVPFCRQKCFYCDFYKTVNTSQIPNFIDVLKKEAQSRIDYIGNETVDTIYFGGGTPTVLTIPEVEEILNFLRLNFIISDNPEITFEANPDDLTISYLNNLIQTGINRLSIGIQSFHDDHLKFMNRRHNKEQAIESVINAEKAGFNNISIDLIYGFPGLTESDWISSLNHLNTLPVQHVSAYHLTYHKGTPFYTWLKKGTLTEITEAESIKQFNLLIDRCSNAGFEQYEISNFAKEKLYSKHNTSYWKGKKYLGLGPSAHSFNLKSRQWNIASLDAYIKAVLLEKPCFEEEFLSETEKYNEYVLTSLRTCWGVSESEIDKQFGSEKKKYFINQAEEFIKSGKVKMSDGIYTFSREGQFISDTILSNLMII